MYSLLAAVKACHEHNIPHRDIKPENILLQNPYSTNIKLIDFGCSEWWSTHKKKGIANSPYYVAPETLRKKSELKSDLWSCGVIMHILLSGYPPFSGSTDDEILLKILHRKYSLRATEWKPIS